MVITTNRLFKRSLYYRPDLTNAAVYIVATKCRHLRRRTLCAMPRFFAFRSVSVADASSIQCGDGRRKSLESYRNPSYWSCIVITFKFERAEFNIELYGH